MYLVVETTADHYTVKLDQSSQICTIIVNKNISNVPLKQKQNIFTRLLKFIRGY